MLGFHALGALAFGEMPAASAAVTDTTRTVATAYATTVVSAAVTTLRAQ